MTADVVRYSHQSAPGAVIKGRANLQHSGPGPAPARHCLHCGGGVVLVCRSLPLTILITNADTGGTIAIICGRDTNIILSQSVQCLVR